MAAIEKKRKTISSQIAGLNLSAVSNNLSNINNKSVRIDSKSLSPTPKSCIS